MCVSSATLQSGLCTFSYYISYMGSRFRVEHNCHLTRIDIMPVFLQPQYCCNRKILIHTISICTLLQALDVFPAGQ